MKIETKQYASVLEMVRDTTSEEYARKFERDIMDRLARAEAIAKAATDPEFLFEVRAREKAHWGPRGENPHPSPRYLAITAFLALVTPPPA